MIQHKDIIIIGGGVAGMSLALSLANTDLNVILLESNDLSSLANPQEDGREVAFNHTSINILKKINVWQQIEQSAISPIKSAKVFNGKLENSLDFAPKKHEQSALGYLVSHYLIKKALYDQASGASNLKIMPSSLVTDIKIDHANAIVTANDIDYSCSLVVAADSKFSKIRNKAGISSNIHDFGRSAIVARVKLEKSHNFTAYECFLFGKTVAILPLNDNYASLVITIPNKDTDSLINLSDDIFNQQISDDLNNYFGQIKLCSKKHVYPLFSAYANKFATHRLAVIGDAAVAMHPVTAQGFNLLLSGQYILSSVIKDAMKNNFDIGSEEVLNQYAKKHNRAAKLLYKGTNIIVSLFTKEDNITKFLRSKTLKIARKLPMITHLITKKLIKDSSD